MLVETELARGSVAGTVYNTTIPTLIPGTAPTDVLVITGSATRTVRVLQINLWTTQTDPNLSEWFIIRRSTDDSGGTPASLTPRVHDTTDAAATAAIREYLANPTLGTSAGILARAKIYAWGPGSLLVPASVSVQPGYTFDFTMGGQAKGITLRGTSDILVVNFNGATLPPGLTVTGWITHAES